MALKPISVSQLNDYISRVIGTDPLLGAIVVKGEISNLKYHSTGHVYFSISDEFSKINCFLPRDYAMELNFQLSDGMEVIITGGVNIFKKNGTYSIYIRNIEISGEGSLSVAFEQLKKKLDKEGLFDVSHKKSIPSFPEKIGIITSDTGAAIKDILKILDNRNNLVDIIIFPVLVQGDGAAKDISAMIDYVNGNYSDIDTLIVGRGGGSTDDLWAFNEEIVARSIYNSNIPIISAVGHEIDFTIADFVSDLRAETPTAAAQLAVPEISQLKNKLAQLRENLYVQLSNRIMYNQLIIDNSLSVIKSEMNTKITTLDNILTREKLILSENNPKEIMKKGYSILSSKDNVPINYINEVKLDTEYNINLVDGKARCIITEIGSDDYE